MFYYSFKSDVIELNLKYTKSYNKFLKKIKRNNNKINNIIDIAKQKTLR